MWEYFRCLLHQVQKLCTSETLLDFKTYIPGSPRQSNFPFQVYTLLSWSAWSRSTAAMWRSWSRLIPITSGSWTVLISPAYTSLSSALTISNSLVVAVGRVKPTLLTCPKAHQQRQRRSKWLFFFQPLGLLPMSSYYNRTAFGVIFVTFPHSGPRMPFFLGLSLPFLWRSCASSDLRRTNQLLETQMVIICKDQLLAWRCACLFRVDSGRPLFPSFCFTVLGDLRREVNWRLQLRLSFSTLIK